MMEKLSFRCDDASGYQLEILRAEDGDFHLRVIPHPEDFKCEHEGEEKLHDGCYLATMRVRAPMTGGGSHEALYWALVKMWGDHRLPKPVRLV